MIGLALMLLTVARPASQDSYSDAVFPGDGAVAGLTDHVHDPTIIPFKGKYFCFSTSGDGFGVLRSSNDMLAWKFHGSVLPETPAWIQARYRHKSMWAPDVVVQGDRLRMYYSISDWGTNKSVIGLAECAHFEPEHPQAGWIDKGLVIESRPQIDAYNAIDPEVIYDEAGQPWMFFGSYFGGIYVVALDPMSGKLKDAQNATPICVARNLDERGNPLEGAAVVRREGYYYLFVSYGLAAQGVRSTYRIMVGRAKSITGPFLDATGKSMTEGGHLNVMNSSPPMFSPGHCDVFRDPSGRWFMPYHFYDSRHYWTGGKWGRPNLQVRELLWSSDGWPMPGLPVEATDLRDRGERGVSGSWLIQTDFGEVRSVELKADGTLTNGNWKLSGSSLTLEGIDAQSLVVHVDYHNTYFVGRNRAGQVVRGIRAKPGDHQ